MRALHILAGVVLGYGASLLTSLGWFLWTNHTPTDPAASGYIAATATLGIVFAVLAGYVAAAIAGTAKAGYGVATLILLFSVLSTVETRSVSAGHGSLWSLYLSFLLMAPAAAAGAFVQKSRSIDLRARRAGGWHRSSRT